MKDTFEVKFLYRGGPVMVFITNYDKLMEAVDPPFVDFWHPKKGTYSLKLDTGCAYFDHKAKENT